MPYMKFCPPGSGGLCCRSWWDYAPKLALQPVLNAAGLARAVVATITDENLGCHGAPLGQHSDATLPDQTADCHLIERPQMSPKLPLNSLKSRAH
jgi:hypothetical protein